MADVFSSNAITLSYDNNGNLTLDSRSTRQGRADDGLLGYVYDGWNP